MLITMFVFRDADTEDSLLVMCLRSGFWVFLILNGVIFLHNKVLVAENDTDKKNGNYEGIFNGGYGGYVSGEVPSDVFEDYVVPVNINTSF